MSDVAIRVEGLSKQYRLGSRLVHRSLRESIVDAANAPIRWIRSFGSNRSTEDRGVNTLFWALKDVSFEVRSGSIVGVVGRNGAGKSTLLKVLSRITEPTCGRAEIHGRVGSLLEVGTGFHPELTGRENVFLNGAILGMRKAEIARQFDEIVAFAQVEQFVDTPVKHYSSGMYLRLAFAVSAHLDPEILVVDEVLAVGDAQFQKKCMGKMGEVASSGRTVLFVSHNMAAVQHLSEDAIWLENGQLREQGRAGEVIGSYMRSFQSDASGIDVRTRKGLGKVTFTGFHLEDLEGRVLPEAISGNPAVLVASYHSEQPGRLRQCRAAFSVLDEFDNKLFLLASSLTNRDELLLPPSGALRCVVPRFPLTQGRYRVGVFLEVGSDIQDWVDGFASLTVSNGDFYGTGQLYYRGWEGKGVLVPHEWFVGDLPAHLQLRAQGSFAGLLNE